MPALGMTHWPCLTSWWICIGVGVLVDFAPGTAASQIRGCHKEPGHFSRLVLQASGSECSPAGHQHGWESLSVFTHWTFSRDRL